MKLSVIIPTHNRAPILKRCLDHLEQQTISGDLEVIIVSDGHDPQTSVMCAEMENGKWEMEHVRFLEIEKSQQGVARNAGVKLATAPLVLFIGDDIFLEPHACATHVRAHEQLAVGSWQSAKRQLPIANCQSYAVLGFTKWDPSVGITETMHWLEKTGWQFGYSFITSFAHDAIPAEIQHQFTYTSHVSLPTAIARAVPFRQDVTLYGWEDIEWGLRLRDRGVPLFYDPGAKALHCHRVMLEESLKRMEILGRSVVTLSNINPALDRMPRGWKLLAYKILALLPTMRGKHCKAFLLGIRSAK